MSTTNKTLRDSGTEHELAFWTKFVHSKQFATWLEPGKTPELDDYVHDFIQEREGDVLDVGSGVVSILTGTVPKERLYTCDPLGAKYAKIFDYDAHGINSPDSFPAEALPYPDNRFEIVHMRNAIDHCEDPAKVIDELFRVTKKRGFVIIQGFEKEGTHENWQGFHQWDVSIGHHPTTHLFFYSKEKKTNFIIQDYYYLSTKHLSNGRNWITLICRK